MSYQPKPIDTSGVRLDPWLEELTEFLAANTHEVWAQARMREGWTFGQYLQHLAELEVDERRVRRIDRALRDSDLPSEKTLATLDRAPGQRLKMGDLAEALVITRGGLTKLVDRLIKAGLLERTFCETDRRVSYATLLPAGVELLAEMRPVVRGELDNAFAANLSTKQADELRATLEQVRTAACGTG